MAPGEYFGLVSWINLTFVFVSLWGLWIHSEKLGSGIPFVTHLYVLIFNDKLLLMFTGAVWFVLNDKKLIIGSALQLLIINN